MKEQLIRVILLTYILLSVYLLGWSQINRNFDGIGNNKNNVGWGAAGSSFKNYASNGFADSISAPGGQNRPDPRTISNALGSQSTFLPNELGLSDFVWGWGQFIDHDINLNDDNLAEPHDIPIPNCEPMFDPGCTGAVAIRMFRSKFDANTGTSITNKRKHINEITSFIDGSAVYGSDSARAAWLRTYTDGKLKTSNGNLLPWNTIDGEYNSPIDANAPFMLLDAHPLPDKFFVGGDVRVNEQPGLISFHTLWVREHNRLCDSLKLVNPGWSDEDIYQRARKIVGALIQVVTYEEFLPNIGLNLPVYLGYDSTIDASIMNLFSAAAYRFGHTMVNGRLVTYDEEGSSWSFESLDLRDGFFRPQIIKDGGGIEPFFRGLAAQEHQMVDPLIMDDLRNFLFGKPGSGGIDLLSINIARGRERGLPDYNTVRKDLLLSPHPGFNSLTSDPALRHKLSFVYGSIDEIDPWIGFMSEDHLPNSIVGEGLATILTMQFSALRDGDWFYYENDPAFTPSEVYILKNTTLSQVILRNTSIETLQSDVFKAVPRDQLSVELFPFASAPNIQLKAYPNPVSKQFTLMVEARKYDEATLAVWSLNGRNIMERKVQLNPGVNEIKFTLSDIVAAGLYTITFQSNEGMGKLKITKIN